MLENKNIVVGVTGGIASYKTLAIVSKLKKAGANVNVIMTEAATEFVKPLTFRSLSQNPVTVEMFSEPSNWDVEHISLADKADLFLIAPATANIIGKIANGIADDMLSTTVMATEAEVIIAPAMNVKMYQNSIVQKNISLLKEHGYSIIEPDKGYLACGYEGQGRFPAPEEIAQYSKAHVMAEVSLEGKKVLVTAGGTKEALDPVRYLGNNSSGKMGYALARVAEAKGAEVTLISAPTNLSSPKGINKVEIETAQEMREEVFKYKEKQDIIIMAAAVADYRPKNKSALKLKKSTDNLNLELEATDDILAQLGAEKKSELLVGFSAESNNMLAYAQKKLEQKNLDLIVANNIAKSDIGFAADKNQVTIIKAEEQIEVTKADKLKIAVDIFAEIEKLIT